MKHILDINEFLNDDVDISNQSSTFFHKIKNKKNKFILALKDFLVKIKNEADETVEAGTIIKKYVNTGNINKEEELKLKKQIADILKIFGIWVPLVIIPGSSVLIPLLVIVSNKFKINLFPSSFNPKIENNINKIIQ